MRTAERVVDTEAASSQLVEKPAWSARGGVSLLGGIALVAVGGTLVGFGAVEGGFVGAGPTTRRPACGTLRPSTRRRPPGRWRASGRVSPGSCTMSSRTTSA